MTILSISITSHDRIIRKSSELTWRAVSVHKMPEGAEKRKVANELGDQAVKYILKLLRID